MPPRLWSDLGGGDGDAASDCAGCATDGICALSLGTRQCNLSLLVWLSSHNRSRLFPASVLLRTANGLVGSEDCLVGQPEEVCDRATESYGIRSQPGFIEVNGVAVVATRETCYAAVSQGWTNFIVKTRAWCEILLVLGAIESTALLCVGYCANFAHSCEVRDGSLRPTVRRLPSNPGGISEACLFLGAIFALPAGVVYLVRRACVCLLSCILCSIGHWTR
jgi:hypothetical protein